MVSGANISKSQRLGWSPNFLVWLGHRIYARYMRLILNYRKSQSIMKASHELYEQKYFMLVSRD